MTGVKSLVAGGVPLQLLGRMVGLRKIATTDAHLSQGWLFS